MVEIEYREAQENAKAFHNVMQDVHLARQRNGAYGWSVARDIAYRELWTERYHSPTWLKYLRQRNRATQTERELDQQAVAFHIGPEPVRIRRKLERRSVPRAGRQTYQTALRTKSMPLIVSRREAVVAIVKNQEIEPVVSRMQACGEGQVLHRAR